ncbi:MAG: c-type cytochrome [Gammaproteobacteria bacterium]
MSHERLGAAILAGAVFGANVGYAQAADKIENPYTGDIQAIEEGHQLWRDTGCYSCHGHDAQGAVGPDLTDDEWVYRPTDATLFKAIAKGRKGTVMVAWSTHLSEDEIWKVVAFIRSKYRGDPKKIIW